MRSSQIFNPLTVARLDQRGDGVQVLELRCYARRRSFRGLRIRQDAEPRLFAALLDWLEGKGDPAGLTIEPEREIQLWGDGLLLSPKERDAVPAGARPGFSDGHDIASLLCPGVTRLLRQGPDLPAMPAGPDPQLAASGYCSLPAQIGDADVAALAGFYRTLSEGGWLETTSNDDARRQAIHNDPAARRIQHALTPAISAVAGEPVKPSYTFASEYRDETPLARHTDRAQCEYTFSLYVDYSPEPDGDMCPWPLVVHAAGGDAALHQSKGGGLLIRGRTLPHSRPPLPPGHRARMVFLHYVPMTFDGPLD